ncbi:DUF2273 domain-containing protein [Paenibacillus sp. J2TS4]|uniref:DUF2273 domain-containing protein n=1 Tax=Paenibacillus sp. J2TS4 TaxID=2807194 RepID=UPI001B2D0E74|nr:DUF2273 domain-containing protein [Paenibacillus sp. J2TS4]GIP32273.1 hypothetical protein J2TS4_14830 [Paenibacillus sp. J2TS4]
MFKQMLESRPGTVIGTLCGVILGILYLIVGFWDTLIFAFIVFIGYYVGKKIDFKEFRLQAENLWQWLSERWRMFR